MNTASLPSSPTSSAADQSDTLNMDWLGCIDTGGGAYVFAKRSVNADKKARHEEEMKRRRLKDALDAEFYAKPPSPKQGHKKPHDHANSPSTEASQDPAPTEHPLGTGGQKAHEEGKYIATKPYKSKKGDRFS